MDQEYIDLINELVYNFSKKISDDELEKERLVLKFRERLTSLVSNIKNSEIKFISKDAETIKRILTKIACEFCDMDITSMKQRLLEDKKLEEIRTISVGAFELAKRKKMGENIEIDFDYSSKIKQLSELLEKVAPYNVGQARKLVSEAVLDLKYVCQSEERVLSLRLYHFMNSIGKKRDEGER